MERKQGIGNRRYRREVKQERTKEAIRKRRGIRRERGKVEEKRELCRK